MNQADDQPIATDGCYFGPLPDWHAKLKEVEDAHDEYMKAAEHLSRLYLKRIVANGPGSWDQSDVSAVMSGKLVPDYSTLETIDFISEELSPEGRARVLDVLQKAVLERLDEMITAGAKPQKLPDGSVGWYVGLSWDGKSPPLIYAQVNAKRIEENEPAPKPPNPLEVLRRERDEARAEVERLKTELAKSYQNMMFAPGE